MTERYLEDFTVGQTFGSGRLRIDEGLFIVTEKFLALRKDSKSG
jgi:hypothetical protein